MKPSRVYFGYFHIFKQVTIYSSCSKESRNQFCREAPEMSTELDTWSLSNHPHDDGGDKMTFGMTKPLIWNLCLEGEIQFFLHLHVSCYPDTDCTCPFALQSVSLDRGSTSQASHFIGSEPELYLKKVSSVTSRFVQPRWSAFYLPLFSVLEMINRQM